MDKGTKDAVKTGCGVSSGILVGCGIMLFICCWLFYNFVMGFFNEMQYQFFPDRHPRPTAQPMPTRR